MGWTFTFFLNSVLLGVGLAMDAFSVSLANGVSEPDMSPGRMSLIAGVYSLFQFMMPMIGWVCVKTIVNIFRFFTVLLPWIALGLLLFIGIKMLVSGIKHNDDDSETAASLTFGMLLLQGVATSIDALSVGFTTAGFDAVHAFVSSVIIAGVTFVICIGGLIIGRTIGTHLAGKANILGGVILIGIGLEIFIKGVFFG